MLLAGIVALIASSQLHHARNRQPQFPLRAKVVRAVDGDTLVVAVGSHEYRVRVIGIDTPEIHAGYGDDRPPDCFGPEAATFTASIANGQSVTLTRESELHDRYGRLLADVRLTSGPMSGRDLGTVLVSRGYAHTLRFPPNLLHASVLAKLESRAHLSGRGLWSAC
jgi:micrococcal nuclease